ncbi:protein TIFY 9 isoform X2 [Nymphaea colorata]|uniref:protein TIFY 9 isoform X2 n=2 Tax=Nymphaea colorata TaxID=210225 RepID=UPI00129D3C06|nr:protein TIFY 9 isoform X2 [Nymphaea colorata]
MINGAAIDFLDLQPDFVMHSQVQKLSPAASPVHSLQRSMSKIDPEVLKNILGARMTERKTSDNYRFAPPAGGQTANSFLPVFHSATNGFPSESPPATAPMTIFYNGVVTVFNVPSDKAEKLIQFAAAGKTAPRGTIGAPTRFACPGFASIASVADEVPMLDGLTNDLPIARRKSLQRFLEKRKGRLTSATPYSRDGEPNDKSFLDAARA